jgi:Phage integrase family
LVFDQIDELTGDLRDAMAGADLVVTHPAQVAAHNVAEHLGVRRLVATVFPGMIPSSTTVPGGTRVGPWPGRAGRAANRMAWRGARVGTAVLFDRPINRHRRRLGLPRVRAALLELPQQADPPGADRAPRFLVDELAAHVEGKAPDELVFSTPAGAPLRNTNFRRRHWDKAVKAAGLDGLTPHDLRHTAASLAVAAGANVKAVQRMLGHASATMTLDVYAGLFGDDLDTVADLLDKAARRAAADSLRTREATGRVLPFASGEGPRRDQGFGASPRGESNS